LPVISAYKSSCEAAKIGA